MNGGQIGMNRNRRAMNRGTLEDGDRRSGLEARGWRLEAGGWRLEAGGWRLEAGGWQRRSATVPTSDLQPPTSVSYF